MDISVVLHDSGSEFRKKFADNLSHREMISKNANGKVIEYDWIDFIMSVIPYINRIYENPKRFIRNDDEILNIEKVKKITTDSVKHLAKHSNLISEVTEERIRPSKLLNVFKEETFNTYENRFIVTLTDLLDSFISSVESKSDDLSCHVDSNFNYTGKTSVDGEDIEFDFVLKSKKDNNTSSDKDFKEKLALIKGDIGSWRSTQVYKSLKKEKAQKVTQPLKRTNVILKNPNFQMAAKLWDFIHSYDLEVQELKDEKSVVSRLTKNYEKNVMNSFLINYYVMKSINASSNYQKKKYEEEIRGLSTEIIKDAIDNIVTSDRDVSKEQLLSIISEHFDKVKTEKALDYTMISNKIKNSTKDYLDRINGSYFKLGVDDQNGTKTEQEEII